MVILFGGLKFLIFIMIENVLWYQLEISCL